MVDGEELDMNFDIDDGEVEEASQEDGFKDVGKVRMDGSEHFLELDAARFSAVLKLFNKIAMTSGDILSRSVRMEPGVSSVKFKATDSLCYAEASLPAKSSGFDKAITFEVTSVMKIASLKANKFYFLQEEDEIFADFFAGKIYVPTTPIDPNEFECDFGKALKDTVVDKEELRGVLSAHKGIVSRVEVPELSYIFLEEGGVFSSDSVIASKVNMDIKGKVVLRQRDVDLLINFIELVRSEDKEFKIKVTSDRIKFICGDYWIVVPQVNAEFSEQYRRSLEIVNIEDYFYIDVKSLSSLIKVLKSMPQDSGVLTLRTVEEALYAEAKTRKEKTSAFVLSTSVEGSPKEFSSKIGLSVLARAISLFASDASVKFAMDGKAVYFFNDTKTQVILLQR